MGARRVNNHEEPAIYATHHLGPGLAIVQPIIGLDETIRIQKHSNGVAEIKTTLSKTHFAFSIIPFELHGPNVGQRTTFFKGAVPSE